jgi:nitrogen regulatory protein PII
MQTYPKKKIEIIIEAPILNRVLDLLDRLAVTGYTVVPALAGRGRDGSWRGAGLVSDTGQMVMIVCITDEKRVSAVLDPVYELVTRQIGIVTVSDCQVVRADHF